MESHFFITKSFFSSVEKLSFAWKTPSNIALIKYWGKTDIQIPKNASVSFTLNNCHTITKVDFFKDVKRDKANFDFFFQGKRRTSFKPKIAQFFKLIELYCPYVLNYRMVIDSKNSFPHSSGIASSASGMSALALCVMSLERSLNPMMSDSFFYKKAAFLARIGSGSATRSIEGPLVLWGQHPRIEDSSDLFGIKFPYRVNPIFENYQDTILLIHTAKKTVSSTSGHKLMENHPYAESRFKQAEDNLSKLIDIFKNGDLKEFVNLVENEALSLHAMMLTSNPYFILMRENTLKIIRKIEQYRRQTGANCCFTLDAGANVHLLYPVNEKQKTLEFIKDELAKFCEKKQYICDFVGCGAKAVSWF